MFFGAINSLEYSKNHLNHQKPIFGHVWPKMVKYLHILAKKKFSKFNKMWVYLYVFGTINSLEYRKINLNTRNYFLAFSVGQKWLKMVKKSPHLSKKFFYDFNMIGVYLYVFWDDKFIGI